MRSAPPIVLSPEEQATLLAWARAGSPSPRLVQRARIVTMAAEGVSNQDIARQLDVSRPTVQLWRERFLALRVAGLEKDAPRPGRIPSIPASKVRAVIEATLRQGPIAASPWSVLSLAEAQEISPASVRRIWKRHGLQPQRRETATGSPGGKGAEGLYNVVGLYLNPPDKFLVISCAEAGRRGRPTRGPQRDGANGLFAALDLLEGKVIGDRMSRHRHREFFRFLRSIDAETPPSLELYLIVGGNGPHRHPRVASWIRRHPRFHLQAVTDSGSWLGSARRWFKGLAAPGVQQGGLRSAQELDLAIRQYLGNRHQNPRVFAWTGKKPGGKALRAAPEAL